MSGVKYEKLQNFDEDEEINSVPESKSTLLSIITLFFIFGFACGVILLMETTVKVPSPLFQVKNTFPFLRHDVEEGSEKLNRNKTQWINYYFTPEESKFLNCTGLLLGNNDNIDQYVNRGRMKLVKGKLLDLPMDCSSVRQRIYGDMPSFVTLKRPIAFLRTVYNIYELQEAFLSLSYHPDNTFCFVMDSKSADILKSSVRKLSDCFENVFVMEEEYDFDVKGHGQDQAHLDCLRRVMDREWYHAILLQNFDLVIKTPYQISDVSELLNYTSIMGFEFGISDRYNKTADWTPAGMKLFKNETGVPDKILHTKLIVRKSLNEVIVSKVFVKSMFEKLNLNNIVKLFNNNNYYGVDEMMLQTLYENYLGLDGQLETNCPKSHTDVLSRLTDWNYRGPDGYTKTCLSKWKRHGICILGVEYLKELSKSRYITANKVLSTFDFGTIACMREMLHRNKTGETPDEVWLSSFPQFREMQMKANGTFNKNTFVC